MAHKKRARSTGPWNGRTDFYRRSLGKQFIDEEQEVVLRIGEHAWTRIELAKQLGCCHLAAARKLTKHLDEAGIDSLNKLHVTPPEELMTIAGVGAVQAFVAMCALDAVGFDAERWYGKDNPTVYTLKDRAKRRQEQRK